MPDEKTPSVEPETPPTPPVVPPVTPPIVPPVTPPIVETVEMSKYKASVREMNIKQQENALLRKELELEKKSKAMPIQAQQNINEVPEHVRQQLEAKYNGKVPFEMLAAISDIQDLKAKKIEDLEGRLGELTDTIYEERYENTKSRLKADDPIFEEFMPEVEAKLNLLPMKQRTNKEELAKIKKEVISDHLMDIVKMAEERGRQSIAAKPPTPPEVNSAGGYTPAPTGDKVTHLTAEQKEMIIKSGGNVQETEAFMSGKAKPKSRLGNYAG